MPGLIERPKMSRAMWDALKTHILKERQKKKQEQEADAAIERLRRERENKQKQDVMTLEETKEQIQQLEQKLSQLKEEKHQLFLQLKKVLNEDEIRRRAIPKETNDFFGFAPGYPQHTIQLGGHPAVFMQAGSVAGRSPLYKTGAPHPQSLIPPGSLKRPRSPSPPPTGYQHGYNFKAQAVAAYSQKPNQYTPQAGPYYHHSSQAHSSSSSYQPVGQTVYTYASHPQYQAPTSSQHAQSTSSSSDQNVKHVQHSYHVQHLPQGYVTPSLHQIEQATQKASFSDEKYFQQHSSVPMRSVNALHHSQTLIPLQQPKPGGITSGFPVRSQPTVTSAAAYPSQSSQHVTYTGPQTAPRITYANQPPPARYY